MKRYLAIFFALLWFGAGGPARAQGDSAASSWVETPQAKVRLVSAVRSSAGQASLPLGLQFQLQPGWKTYWRDPGDAGLPATLDWTGSSNLAGADLAWPVPMRFTLFGLDTFGYENEVVLPIEARPADSAKPMALRLKVDYLVCEKICIPESASLALDLPAGPPTPSDYVQLIDRYAAQVPGNGAAHGLTLESAVAAGSDQAPLLKVAVDSLLPFAAPDLIVEGPKGLYFPKPSVSIERAGHRALLQIAVKRLAGGPPLAGAPLTLTVVDGSRGLEAKLAPAQGEESGTGLWPILLAAVLGGMILNLMPCVLPVLSLKLLAFVGHGGKERTHVRLSFLASTAGVLASFLLLAGLLAALRAGGQAAGWGLQFQQPLFLAGMAFLLTLLAGNLWGWFEIPLPGFAGRLAETTETARGFVGDFLTGALATLLATPCTVPFIAPAVGFALAGSTGQIFAIFLLIGLGLSTPYLLVAAFPGLALHLPHPGRWMLQLKRLLGLGLGGTAIWLVYVLAGQVGRTAALATAAALVLAAAILAWHGLPRPWRRSAVLLAGGLALLAPVLIAESPAPAVADGVWRPYSEAALGDLLTQGRVVLVDVTADWCINCQVNHSLVLDRGWAAEALGSGQIAGLRADWTSPNPAIARYLASFGRYGIPFDAIYGPRAPQGLALPSLLTEDALRKAVEAAGGG